MKSTSAVRVSRKRGNDGLTDAQRAASAKRWRLGVGKAPSPAEVERLSRFPLSQASAGQAG